LFLVVSLCAVAAHAQERPVPPAPIAQLTAPDTIDGIAPILLELATLEAKGTDWTAHAMQAGATLLEQKQVVVEFTANGRYTLWHDSVQVRPELTFAPELKESLARKFPDAQLIPTSATTIFRAWIKPSLAAPMFEHVREAVPTVTLAPYRAPEAAAYGSVVSEGTGVGRMYTEWYNSLGVAGSGVKVAVIDLGFQGIDTWAANEVGQYTRLSSQSNINSDASEHGTGCCEIIRDVAPGCEMRVYRLDAQLDVWTAAADAVNWGADIVSVSVAWHELPQEGLACSAATMAVTSGVHWVNAAGNYADGAYWESANVGLMSWGGATYVDYDAPFQDPYQLISNTYSGDELRLFFAYEAPNGTYARFSLELWRWDGSSPYVDFIAAGSAGSTAQWIEHTTLGAPYSYYALIRQTQSGVIGRMREFVRGTYAKYLYFSNARGSVANPATLPQVHTIGAVNQSNYASWGAPEAYSSRGGGIWNLPLDWCAPTAVSCAAYGPQGFGGTSASAPHFAGLLACQLGDIGLSADPTGFLWTRDQGPVGWDPDSGWGAVLAYVDASEQDNTSGTAFNLGSSSTTATGRSISPGVDVDWFRFSLSTPQAIVLETLGNGNDDTVLTLYNSSLGFVAEDDDSGTNFFSRIQLGVLAAGTWYVTVESYNNESVVDGYSLTLTISPPSPPGPVPLLSPADGATDVPLPVTLTWGGAGGSVSYDCEVAADAQFTNIVFSQQGLSALSTTVNTLAYATIYYWRVRAVNQYGTGPWSSRTFRTEESLPGPPALVLPVDAATNQPTTITFEWSPPTVGTGPFNFELQVATNAAFTGTTQLFSGVLLVSHEASGLQHDTTYYWRVRAMNPQGYGPWSPTRNLTTAKQKKSPKSKSGSDGCASVPGAEWGWAIMAMALLVLCLIRPARKAFD
jgi:hypothetical protein